MDSPDLGVETSSPLPAAPPLAAVPLAEDDPTGRIDELLEACLAQFLPLAPVADPGRLRDHLPADAPQYAAFLMAEMVKLDMAALAERGVEPRLDDYLDAAPDLLPRDRTPFDLVIEEFQLRRELGHDPKRTEYAERFPQHADLLERFSCNAETVAAAGKPAAPAELAPGDRIDDFAVVQQLGRGAFAQVYLARQLSMQRLVALKVSAGKGDEPQALAQFDHPNIVRVYDQRAMDDGATHLLYMQYLPGGTLADVVKRVRWNGPSLRSGRMLLEAVDDNLLSASQQRPEDSSLREWLAEANWPVTVAWLGVQLAHALDEAHRRGVLHRDVKPANVLLSPEGVPKLADFNVSFAGAAGRAGAAATLGGSIGYMAPEHLAAIGGQPGATPEGVRERADLYSLAVLLWELWQGRRPFATQGQADCWTTALRQQADARGEPLVEPERTRAGGVEDPSERVLEGTLRRTLDADPDQRPATGAELAGRLQLALHPEAAELFDPPSDSWRAWLFSLPAILLIALATLTPNIAAGLFNYFYNEREIIGLHPEMKRDFVWLSTCVNATFFPLGGAIAAWVGVAVARAVRRAKRREGARPDDLRRLFLLPYRGAWIGGALWAAASLIFPIVLSVLHPAFPTTEAAHFCLSLLVCGAVAAVYPYFLLVTLVTAVYYPRVVRQSMTDPEFDARGEALRRDGERFLAAAAVIPLVTILLLVGHGSDSMADLIVYTVLTTLLGLFASFHAYRYVLGVWARIRPVLSQRRKAGAPDVWDSIG
ncbi:serine/threonine-protein kinase [Botrimarina sp.]|uniref:serine/threonine-protein kinase n=1 Tax=Botrimarina sp. TaxID=2795802 RepID=UPI0032EB0BE5